MKKHGFSLVEMAIMLVIIGALVGAILSGKNIADASKKEVIIADFQKYSKAYYAFKEKFNQPPGDFAGRVLGGTATDICVSPGVASPLPVFTPDSDGIIDAGATNREAFCAWRQLASAGLIEGQYAGINTTSGPKGPYENTYYEFDYYTLVKTAPGWNYGLSNAITIGALYTTLGAGSVPVNAKKGFLTPTYAASIDTKIDDGAPLTGKLFGFNGVNNDGSTDLTSLKCLNYTHGDASFYDTASYNTSGNKKGCYLIYMLEEISYKAVP
jgi:hypothetical protein